MYIYIYVCVCVCVFVYVCICIIVQGYSMPSSDDFRNVFLFVSSVVPYTLLTESQLLFVYT